MAQSKPNPSALPLFDDYAIEKVMGAIAKLPDPDIVLKQFGMGRQELRKLESDDEITAALETRREAVIATSWSLEPYEGEPVEWLWKELEKHCEVIMRGAWSAIPYGYTVQEVIYNKLDTGRITWSYVSEKPLEWFEPRRDGTLVYSPPSGSGSGSAIVVDQEFKFLLTRRNPTYRNPYGESLLSRLYWPWFFRYNSWRFWMTFLERFADPLLLGKVYNPNEFVAVMKQLGMSSVVGVGHDENIEAITASASGEFTKIEDAIVERIQKTILGQTLTSQMSSSGGSFAAAKVHNEVRGDKKRADIRLITTTVQRAIKAIWVLNGFPGDCPLFVLQDATGLELERADRDAKLAQAGVIKFTDRYLIDRYDLVEGDFTIPSDAGDDSSTQGVDPVSESVNAKFSAGSSINLAARPQRFSQDQELVEDLVDNVMGKVSSPIPASKLKAVILASSNNDELVERLGRLYLGNDRAEFQELVSKALFTADVLGYSTADKKVINP